MGWSTQEQILVMLYRDEKLQPELFGLTKHKLTVELKNM